MGKITVRIRGPVVFEKILGSRETELSLNKGSTLQDLLEELDVRTDGRLKRQLYDREGKFRKGTRIFLNGRDIRFVENRKMVLEEDDRVLLLPLLAGG